MNENHAASTPTALDDVLAARELYWRNVVREMLAGLAMMRPNRPELFDGRVAVLTQGGERIPIADLTPMFACSLNSSGAEREASVAVECTVFRIKTPTGEVFTLPVQEVRMMHALSPELIEQLEQQAMTQLAGMTEDGDPEKPFGLAAFRKLTPILPGWAPGHPNPDEYSDDDNEG